MNTEVYSLATCPGTKYSGDTITLIATPRDGIGPYYVAFKKDGIIIDPSRLGTQPNPILNAPENVEIVRTYTLNDEDVRNALTGTTDFSVFIRGSCPTGGGLQFDGVDDYVNAGNAASLDFGTAPFTVSLWIKFSTTARSRILSKIGGANIGFDIVVRGPTGVGILEANICNISCEQFYGTGVYNDNLWHHVVLYRNGINAYLIVDTITEAIVVDNLRNVNITVPLEIGRISGGGQPFNGYIDEVRIYNRALSPTEILGLYNGSTPRNGLVLEHIYSLGNANDLSGYGNNGTPINGPIFIPNACMDTCTIAIGCVAPVCNFVVT